MNSGRTVFCQVMDLLPLGEFRKCVERYGGHDKMHSFSCLDQFLCMAFAQLTCRESLRDTVACLRSAGSKLYHMGFRGRIARSTLADANERRDWRIYADFAQVLIHRARQLYRDEDLGLELGATVYALDSTTIDLCLSLFPWARFQRAKGAIKLHTLLDLRGPIPSFIRISDGKLHDVKVLDEFVPEAGSFYVMDRGYLDYARLYLFTQSCAFFVIRTRRNTQYRRLVSRPVDRSTGLRADQTIVLTGLHAFDHYPSKLRRVSYVDLERHNRLLLLTNNFTVPALTVTELFRCRWKVELFFKWIKQHLRIKAFYGRSENAVKTQVWTAISLYVLVALLKKRLGLGHSLYTILQILSVNPFEKILIPQLLTQTQRTNATDQNLNQLMLFDL